MIGGWATPRESGLGGWSLDLHHTYDPLARTLYLGDGRQRQAEAFSPIITTIAGTGQAGADGDGGPAVKARIGGVVRGMAIAADGSLYFSDTSTNRVRRIAPDGTITTVAGAPGPPQDLGDDGPATAARVGQPTGLALAPDGTLYILAERRLRKVSPDGIITTLADLQGITSQPLHGLLVHQAKGSTRVVAQRLALTQRSVERYLTGECKLPLAPIAQRIKDQVRLRWQLRVGAAAQHQAATAARS